MHESNRRSRVRLAYIVWALVVLLVVAACAGTTGRDESVTSQLSMIGLEVEADAGKMALDGDGATDRLMAPLTATAGSFDEVALLASEAEAPDRVDDALIVRTASLELEVADVAAILTEARDEIGNLGGYVSGSDEYDQGDRRWASVTYRVPVDRFSQAIDSLRGLSDRVTRESTQSQEVTATVVDLDARIANLRASEEALVAIMDRSGRMEDVLAVQMRLEDVRGQIERLEAQRNNLADQAALSTIAAAWFTPVAAVTVAQQSWNLGAEVDTALAQTVQALQGLASLGVWLGVVVLPLLIVPLLLVVGLYLWLRRRARRGDHDGPAALTPTPAE